MTDTLFVEEGSSAAVTNSCVYISDIDTEFGGSPSADHMVTVVMIPRDGQLLWTNGSVIFDGDRFTLHVRNLSWFLQLLSQPSSGT